MKKLISLFLMVCMMATLLAPVSTFAQEDEALQKAILSVKAKIDIPKEFTKFDYSVYTRSGKKVWNLTWSSKTGDGSTHATVDEKGTILGYGTYDSTYYQQGKIAKVNKEQAKELALKFIKKVNADVVSKIRYVENNQNTFGDYIHQVVFERMVNNIPFNSNNIRVEVNRQNGNIQGYSLNWDEELVFPSAEKVITLEQAQKAYKEKLGLTLMYNYKIENDKIVTYLTYANKYNNYFIDALTGEKVQLQSEYYGPYYGGDMERAANMQDAKKENLTPEEIKAVKEVAGLLTQEDAEKIARESKHLNITSDLKVRYVNLYKDWQPTGNMVWNLEFSKEPTEKDADYRYVGVRINAKSGEIVGFNTSYNHNGDEKAKFDEKASKEAVDKFLKEFAPVKYANTELDESYKDYPIPYYKSSTLEMPGHHNLKYSRKVNGIPFAGNGITVGFDAVAGKVTSYDCQWFDNASFASTQNVVAIDQVYEKLFSEVGYYLQYKLQYNREVYEKYMGILPDGEFKPEVKLVYGPNPEKPLIFDALKNILLSYNGEPYKENKGTIYTDIDNSFAKTQIIELAENGIVFEGDKFDPQNNITQKEYLFMIAKAMYPYETFKLSNKDDVDRMYANLIREGIVKKEERSQFSTIKREDSVKFLIRAMKLDKAAEIKGIYNCQFKDANDISADLIGYVTLANGLKLVSGDEGYFNPQGKLTKEQAAAIIYNYMQK